MFKKFILTLFVLCLSYGNANSFSHDKLKKGLKDLEKGINKELNKANQQSGNNSKTSNTKKELIKEKNKNVQNNTKDLEPLNQKISSTNKKKLIYCEINAERVYLQNFRNNKKGDRVKRNFIIVDIEEDLKNCSNYKPLNRSTLSRLEVLSTKPADPKKYENFIVNSMIEWQQKTYKKNFPFGSKVTLVFKGIKTNQFHTATSKDLVLKKSDLLIYCATEKGEIGTVRFANPHYNSIDVRCRNSSYWVALPVSKGSVSADDAGVPGYGRFLTKTERQNKEIAEKAAKQQKKEAYQKKQREKQEYNDSPEGTLVQAYQHYLIIKGFYESRKGYKVVYVNSSQFSSSKKKIKTIESVIKSKGVDTDKAWNKATAEYKKQWESVINMYKSSGTYTNQASQNVKLQLMALDGIHNKLSGGSKIKKDF